MSSPSLIVVRDDGRKSNSSPGPRSGGPTPRRSFTPAQKPDNLAAYEAAIRNNEGELTCSMVSLPLATIGPVQKLLDSHRRVKTFTFEQEFAC